MRLSIAGIYFRGLKSWNILLGFIFTDGGILINPAWIFLCYCKKISNIEILWKKQTFAILKQIFYGRCINSIIRHYS